MPEDLGEEPVVVAVDVHDEEVGRARDVGLVEERVDVLPREERLHDPDGERSEPMSGTFDVGGIPLEPDPVPPVVLEQVAGTALASVLDPELDERTALHSDAAEDLLEDPVLALL